MPRCEVITNWNPESKTECCDVADFYVDYPLTKIKLYLCKHHVVYYNGNYTVKPVNEKGEQNANDRTKDGIRNR